MAGIAVIGGGFSGLILARTLQRLGYNVDLVEEHTRVGYPEHCTGIVSSRTVELIGPEAKESILDKYSALEIRLGGKPVAYIKVRRGLYRLDRVGLEARLLESFISDGGNALLGRKALTVTPQGRVEFSGSSERKYDIVVLAEGAFGRLRRDLGIGYMGSYHLGLNAVLPRRLHDEIVVDFPLSEGVLFTWSVASGSGNATVIGAMGTAESVSTHVKSLVRGHTKIYGGRIPAGPPPKRLWIGNVFTFGDAAGMVKPVSGGGLYPSSYAADLVGTLHRRKGHSIAESLMKALTIVRLELASQEVLARMSSNVQARRAIARVLEDRQAMEVIADYDKHEDLPLDAPASMGLSLYFKLLSTLAPLLWRDGLDFLARLARYQLTRMYYTLTT